MAFPGGIGLVHNPFPFQRDLREVLSAPSAWRAAASSSTARQRTTPGRAATGKRATTRDAKLNAIYGNRIRIYLLKFASKGVVNFFSILAPVVARLGA